MIVRKQSGMNSIEVVEGIKARVEEVRPTLPPGYQVDILRDQSEFVLAAVGAVFVAFWRARGDGVLASTSRLSAAARS